MESAFRLLPPLYPSSKFCLISAADVGTSLKFKMEALPAMLVYKGRFFYEIAHFDTKKN